MAALVACGDEPTVVRDIEASVRTVQVQGAPRTFRYYMPEGGHQGPRPLVLVFHGATQPAASVALMSWMYPVADEEGILVAYPQSTGDYWNTPNSPGSYWDVADVQFVDALIDDLDALHGVDRGRVYAMGYSNGAIFTQVLACTRGDDVAAVSVIGASVSLQVAQGCGFQRAVPATFFLGNADPQFFWANDLAAPTGMLGGAKSAEWWALNNGCSAQSDTTALPDLVDDDTSVQLWTFRGCPAGADIAFYKILGGGHTWPGSPLNMSKGFGRQTRDIDASRLSVDFFLDHALPGGGS